MTRSQRAASVWIIAPALAAALLMASGGPPARAACNPASFRIVIDVGHTAAVPGAKSARGAYEYDFNLGLAKQVERELIEAGFPRAVLMVTDEPPPRGLFQRARNAGALRGDLLLSIHHDSVPDSFLERWEFEGEQRGFSDRFRGHSIFVSTLNPALAASQRFARHLGLKLKSRGLTYTRHYAEAFMGRRQRELLDAEAGVYRYDQLVALKDARMPAVLLEAGLIINRDEELLLATPEHQAAISGAVAEAATAYCADSAPTKPAHIVRRPPPRPTPRAAQSPAPADAHP